MVKIKTIHLDERGKPTSVVAELSVEEAAWISKTTGTLSPDRHPQAAGMSGDLDTTIFNPFWEDGVDGYLRGDAE